MSNLLDNLNSVFPTALDTHTADTGQSWVRISPTGVMEFTPGAGGFVRAQGAQVSTYRSSWVPASADYDVQAIIKRNGSGSGYVVGRAGNSQHTCYLFGYNTAGHYEMYSVVNDAYTPIGTNFTAAVANGDVVDILLQMRGTAIKGFVGGVERISATSSSITAVGSAGISGYNGGGTMEFDSMTALDVAAGDTTAPTLTSPTGTSTGATTGSGTVTTNEGNGTLYFLASTNAIESSVTVKAAGSQAVSSTGVKSVSFTSLTTGATYFAHYCHTDAAGNDSTVANSASFIPAAATSSKAAIFYFQLLKG